MSTLEYLLFLTPKGVMLSNIGSKQRVLRWEDVAAAMGMGNLSEEAYLLGRAKYCHDISAGRGLQKVMTEKSSRLITSHKWKSARDLSGDLAKVACLEALSNHNCQFCRGTGVLYGQVCEACSGAGRSRISEVSKYTLVNMDKRNWQRRWRSRYEEIYQMLVVAENELSHHLAVQFH